MTPIELIWWGGAVKLVPLPGLWYCPVCEGIFNGSSVAILHSFSLQRMLGPSVLKPSTYQDRGWMRLGQWQAQQIVPDVNNWRVRLAQHEVL